MRTVFSDPVHSEDFGSKYYRAVGCPNCGGTYDSREFYCLDCKQEFSAQDLKSWAKFLHRFCWALKRFGIGIPPLGRSILPFHIPQLSSDRRAFLLGEQELREVTRPDYIRKNILKQSGWARTSHLIIIAEYFSRALREVLEREKPKKDEQP